MVGYDGNFVSPLESRYKCTVCNLALREPVQTECGHRLCKDCYVELQKKSGSTGEIICPVDKSIILPHQVFPDIFAKREVLNLLTNCIYVDSGCPWKGALRDFEEHITKCEFEDKLCPLGCKQRVPKHVLEKHIKEVCPKRRVECEYCKQTVVISDLKAHYDACDCYPVDCVYNCRAGKIPRKLLQEHYDLYCENAVSACNFSFCGCNFRGSKDEINAHLEKETTQHLKLAAQHANSLEAKNSDLQKKLDMAAMNVGVLQQNVVEQGKEINVVKQKYSTIEDRLVSLEMEVKDLSAKSDNAEGRLGQLERKSGPNMLRDIDALREKAHMIELRADQIKQKVNESVQFTEIQMSGGPVSLSGGKFFGGGNDGEKRMEKLENQLALQDVQIAELNLKLQLLESTSYDGKLLWKIDNYQRRKQDAITGKSPSLYSPPFFTSRFGYKMCARIYLNGDGQGKGSHISLFFVVMRSEYDALLEWPFPCKITMRLLAQDGSSSHIVEAFRPDPNSSSFRRPSSEMNIASGVPLFASQHKVASGPYVKKDCIFVQVTVDMASLKAHFS